MRLRSGPHQSRVPAWDLAADRRRALAVSIREPAVRVTWRAWLGADGSIESASKAPPVATTRAKAADRHLANAITPGFGRVWLVQSGRVANIVSGERTTQHRPVWRDKEQGPLAVALDLDCCGCIVGNRVEWLRHRCRCPYKNCRYAQTQRECNEPGSGIGQGRSNC